MRLVTLRCALRSTHQCIKWFLFDGADQPNVALCHSAHSNHSDSTSPDSESPLQLMSECRADSRVRKELHTLAFDTDGTHRAFLLEQCGEELLLDYGRTYWSQREHLEKD